MEIIKANQELKQNSAKSIETSTRVHSETERKIISSALATCMAVQRTYGRQASDLPLTVKAFSKILSDWPADEIVIAVKQWILESPDFPTPADLNKLMLSRTTRIVSKCRFDATGKMTHDEHGKEV